MYINVAEPSLSLSLDNCDDNLTDTDKGFAKIIYDE